MENYVISKRTIGVSIGGLVALASGFWAVTTTVLSYAAQIESNTRQIQVIVTGIDLGRVDDRVSDLQSETRELRRELRRDPENDLILDQLDVLFNEIEKQKAVRECITTAKRAVCE